MSQEVGTVKKRKSPYSRKGCLQCKKSHTKCDETKPKCLKCMKRNIKCTYKVSFVFQQVDIRSGDEGCAPPSSSSLEIPCSTAVSHFDDLASQGSVPPLGSDCLTPHPLKLEESPNFATVDHNLDLRDFIFVSQTDLNLLNLLTFDTEDGKETAPYIPGVPLTTLFQLSWRHSTWEEFYDMLKTYDPIQIMVRSGKSLDASSISLDDPRLLNFIWTTTRVTLGCGNFIMFPQDRYDKMVQLFLNITEKHPIVERVLIYDVALYLKDLYFKQELKEFSHIWDRYIRMPTLKVCLDTLQQRINKTREFTELVSLALTVLLLFAANSTYRNAEWRTHLKGCWHMLQSTRQFIPKCPTNFIDQNCMAVYEILEDNLCHSEILACITSDNAGSIKNPMELENLLSNAPYSKIVLFGEKYDLIRGYTTDLFPIFTEICLKLIDLRNRGYNLNGTNILVHRLLNKDENLAYELQEFGRTLLQDLVACKPTDEDLREAARGASDFRLQFSMKNSVKAYYHSLELYLKIFFLRVPLDSPELVTIVEKILEYLYAMPYYTTTSIACHWGIYLSGMVASLLNQKALHLLSIDILSKLASNGMIVAANSITRLTYINRTLESKDYHNLVNPSHDFITF
ncbi:HCR011Wp [Eremothecium sinecaudum]|uniref:HCR011Wp n=1 Tax=Eremothecium sinecaudum TaxID=45286 RepID=A0A109UYR3_9SACH|nr:HCR011Wp [Eremothecium sinecaudum]AMD20161.1 HCR011Wp [Eremothecium sinecaudum]